MHDETHLRSAFAIARQAVANGNHPFGALLVDASGTVLLAAENTVTTSRDCTGHAETNLVRLASQQFTPEQLANTTMYASTEPCPMCAGALHWAGIGRLVYGLAARSLYEMVGPHPANFDLPCREVFARSSQPMVVVGPLLEDEARAVHGDFWGG